MAKDIVVRIDEGKPAVKLPKLMVNIYRCGQCVRRVEIDDPREKIIHTFNRDYRELGLIAELA